jgi:hypothetical protein
MRACWPSWVVTGSTVSEGRRIVAGRPNCARKGRPLRWVSGYKDKGVLYEDCLVLDWDYLDLRTDWWVCCEFADCLLGRLVSF